MKFFKISNFIFQFFKTIKSKIFYFLEKKGLYLAVHNNSYKPDVQFEGVKLPVGFSADVSVHRYFYDRLGPPYGSCKKNTSTYTNEDTELYKETLKLGRYSRRICLEICLQSFFILPKCNCTDPAIPALNRTHYLCHTPQEIKCIDNVRNDLDSTDLSVFCDHECPVDCYKIDYLYDINLTDYPTEYYFNTIVQQSNIKDLFDNTTITYEKFKESLLLVNVFYKDLSYTLLEEIPSKHLSDILGEIGGQIGLFLGVSVLTLFEPLEFFIEVIYKLINSSNRKSRTVVSGFMDGKSKSFTDSRDPRLNEKIKTPAIKIEDLA
ncbi:unnamed protein product [Brachionus calyciflorus]|uniref:Uncharacterized protein n=1 Tax=Brachionus calyciflorus TaxID=104777 RepID=A0A814Q2W4_9BILA|nr:unnamed protein product [Brachionus calyciflorus]